MLHGPVAVSRSPGTSVVPGEDVWGLFDQTMTYVNMSKMTVDFSPNTKDTTKMWLGISFPMQDLIRHPETTIPKRQNLRRSERDGILAKFWQCWGMSDLGWRSGWAI